MGAKIQDSERLPSQEVAAEPPIREGVAQIVALYRALVVGLKAHLDPMDAAKEFRKALGLLPYQTAIALRNPGRIDAAAVGASYVNADLITRVDQQLEDPAKMSTPELEGSMRNARFEIEAALVVALWHDEKVRKYLRDQGVAPPPAKIPFGGPIDPPLEGPDHVLRVPDLHDPAEYTFSTWWFRGPQPGTHDDALLVAVTDATELTGLRPSFQGFEGLLRKKS